MEPTKLLIDGDILVYRVGFATDKVKDGKRIVEPVRQALRTVDKMVVGILMRFPEVPYKVYLSGPSADNYRHDYAVTAPYKGNRTKPKPEHYDAIRQHLLTHYDCDLTETIEADDQIAIDHTALYSEPEQRPVIVSIDKDFDQLPGAHYNFVKDDSYWVSEVEALEWLFIQVLDGDIADNIKGVRGVGEKTARKIYKDCASVPQYYRAAIRAFMSKQGLNWHEAVDRVRENLILAYLLREDDDPVLEKLVG